MKISNMGKARENLETNTRLKKIYSKDLKSMAKISKMFSRVCRGL